MLLPKYGFFRILPLNATTRVRCSLLPHPRELPETADCEAVCGPSSVPRQMFSLFGNLCPVRGNFFCPRDQVPSLSVSHFDRYLMGRKSLPRNRVLESAACVARRNNLRSANAGCLCPSPGAFSRPLGEPLDADVGLESLGFALLRQPANRNKRVL